MAEAGKIYHEYTTIETDENNVIWLVQNHFESDSVIAEMESTAHGNVIIDEGWMLDDEVDWFEHYG